jgi:hypothetical protein
MFLQVFAEEKGEVSEAESLARRALALSEGALGVNHVDNAPLLHLLAVRNAQAPYLHLAM